MQVFRERCPAASETPVRPAMRGYHDEYVFLSPGFVVKDDGDVFFVPAVCIESFLLVDYPHEDARLRIANLANQAGVKGSIARVAYSGGGGGGGGTALKLHVMHIKQSVLEQFRDELCTTAGAGGANSTQCAGIERTSRFVALHQKGFQVHFGGPRCVDGRQSTDSVQSFALSPTSVAASTSMNA